MVKATTFKDGEKKNEVKIPNSSAKEMMETLINQQGFKIIAVATMPKKHSVTMERLESKKDQEDIETEHEVFEGSPTEMADIIYLAKIDMQEN